MAKKKGVLCWLRTKTGMYYWKKVPISASSVPPEKLVLTIGVKVVDGEPEPDFLVFQRGEFREHSSTWLYRQV